MDQEITSISDFLKFVRKGQPNIATFIYRGQPAQWIGQEGITFDTFLLPSILRQHTRGSSGVPELEDQMMADFKRESPSILSSLPKLEIEWMALAQHHGVPTRLLDWTTNPLVALFFAVQSGSEFDSTIYRGAVYNAQIYKKEDGDDTVSFDQEASPFRFYMPTYVDQRLAAQSSCFTLHPQFRFSQQTAYHHHFQEILPTDLNVITCRVPNQHFGKIKAELYEVGISPKTMFPGLDGLCDTIRYARTAAREHIREDFPYS